MSKRYSLLTIIALLACLLLVSMGANAERRDQWFRIRVPAYGDFFRHYNSLYRIGALANYWNLNVYDVQQTRPTPGYLDGPYYQRMRSLAVGGRIRLDPDLETAAPRFARLAWGVGESFMWTHHLHENAFDAYAAPGLSMEERRRMVESATDDYFRNPRALSDVEIPMERVRQLPYHGAFARNYPQMVGLVWAGHWFHGGAYEGQLAVLRGEQTREQMVAAVEAEFLRLVNDPPDEHPHFTHIAPEFSSLHPRAAAIFSNMHMLHDMVADILADDRIRDKRSAIFEARDMMLAGALQPDAEGGVDREHQH
jgi:hypothetical protein